MPKANRTVAITDDLLRAISSGELRPGGLLPAEAALCLKYGAGRSTVREAIKILAAKGFVDVRQGMGTVVTPVSARNELDPDFLRVSGTAADLGEQLIEARVAVEPTIAHAAAERATAEQRATIRGLAEELAAVGATDPTNHARIDVAFHQLLAEATGNPVLVSLHSALVRLGTITRERAAQNPGAVDRAVMWHRVIAEAVLMHDGPAAADAMRLHLRQVRAELRAVGPLRGSDRLEAL